MTPFREVDIKWDGDDSNGRYENKHGYKFHIINQTQLKKTEDMPKYFLADTSIEAEDIYNRFEKILNNFAYSYSVVTKINKADLFGESLIGLARAYRDWDPSRSDNFEVYAKFVIKDTLNEFVRSNNSIVSIPAYIKKASNNLKKIKAVCEIYDVDWRTIAINQNFPKNMESSSEIKCKNLINTISRAAERNKMDYEKFVDRIDIIPENIEYNDEVIEVNKRETEVLESAVIVSKLKECMTEQELIICDGIMLEKSFEEIGKSIGKTKGWVSNKLKKLREKIVLMMGDGTL